jgi:serine/threonine protein kinase
MLEARLVINQCYILQERLGEDSFCELWRASSIYSATQFLLRFMKEGSGLEAKFADFRDAAMGCYAIAAPAVMDFVEIERLDGRGFIASEYGGQRSLLEYLKGSPDVRLEHACRFVIELGTGIDAFHKLGIVYRCLNAENVLVTAVAGVVETIRVQKPGYAAFLSLVAETDKRATMENFGYMAPEAKAGGSVDRRSDLYSLGVHLFRFIVGKLPYGTAARARSGSVSLSYVSRAFTRRGVPRPVTLAVLKALRKNPAQRHGEVLELIAELRAFMDDRRRELLSRGEVDPIAELSSLNLDKDRVDATQAVKSLDTADYFRSISEAFVAASSPRPVLMFPVRDFASPEELERIELSESEGAEDDGSLSPEDYLVQAEASVRKESISRRPSQPVVDEKPEDWYKPPLKKAEAPPAESMPPLAPPEAYLPKPFIQPLILTPEPPSALPEAVGAFASDPASPRARKKATRENVDAGGISWRQDVALPDVVVAGMESAFSRAFKGTGAFRFIQEPPPGPEAVPFARIFARFRARGLVADLGTLPKDADATDLLRALRISLATGLSYESPQARAVLAKRLRAVDTAGSLKAAPLGALLLGADAEEPDPEWVESMEGAMRSALAIASLGRRRRPLILTMRGSEAVGPSAHAVLVELARLAPIASFCCFAFYKPSEVPSWHVLSRLTPSRGTPVPRSAASA